jgi:ABC-2 type transport system permease protein
MTITTAPLPRGPLDRLRWALVDCWTITLRDLRRWASDPAPVVFGLLFSVMVLLMFAYLFGGGMAVPGGGSYREYLMPGMFAMTMLFGTETTFAAVATDLARGVTDRFRSLPMASSAVVAGRSAADMLHSVVGLALMIGCGLAVGWRWHGGVAGALAAFGLLLLLRLAVLWLAIFSALLLQNPAALSAVQILVWPVGFLSSAFVGPATMPGWLGAAVEWNPLSATATAARQLFGNPGWPGGSWAAQHALLLAVVWPLVLIAVFFPLSIWSWRRLSR